MTVDCLWLTATDRRSLCDHATTSLRLNVIAVQSLAASATALRFVFYTCDLSTTTGRKRSQRSRKAGVTTVLMNTITWYISAVMMEQSMEEQLNDSFIIQ